MEQIELKSLENKDGEHTYILSVFFNHSLYECTVSEATFASEFVEVEHLDVLLYEGLRPGLTKKFDENLQILTQHEHDGIEDTLRVSLKLTFKKGKMKARVEQHEFVMSKRTVDTQTAILSVMRNVERGMNVATVQAHSTNIYINVCPTELSVTYTGPEAERVELCSSTSVDAAFLERLCSSDATLARVVENRMNAQDTITKHVQDSLRQHFLAGSIYALVGEHMAGTFCVNFLRICADGNVIVNVDKKRAPHMRKYYVTNDIKAFTFEPQLNYRILQDFCIPTSSGVDEICIHRTQNGWVLYKNDEIVLNRQIQMKVWSMGNMNDILFTTDVNGRVIDCGGTFRLYIDGRYVDASGCNIKVFDPQCGSNPTGNCSCWENKTISVIVLQRGLKNAKQTMTLIENF